MRTSFIISAIAISSVSAAGRVFKRQDHDVDTTTHDATHDTTAVGTDTTSAIIGSGTPAADPCQTQCDKASFIYSTCHALTNSLSCFCTPDSINGLGDCAYCRDQQGTTESTAEAAALKDSLGGIINACLSSSVSVAPPTKVTVATTARITNPAQITAPAAAKLTSVTPSKSASATGSKSAIASGSKSASATKSGTSSTGTASTKSNGASALDMSLAGLLGAGAIVLFI
ncbi:hypothetical protein V5O48_004837 [Marasmius crinis-equi]|uniref:Extracellular membrane protein CFEM domain-containing protein n=1 Tax=Marasmius crinis-equi TaxID=585013 RepID=A0ABR3FPE4_9AGAR